MSGESDSPGADPSATLQLQAIEGLEGIVLDDAALKAGKQGGALRLTPPPLPREASVGAAPAARMRTTLAYAAMLIAVVGLAMAAGLRVGSRARAKFGAAAAASASVAPASGPARTAAPTASPSARELTLPPIEIKGP
jgi:hypothetical protein